MFFQVYSNSISKNLCDTSIYYLAWKLRGDNPSYYKHLPEENLARYLQNRNHFSIKQLSPTEWGYYDLSKIGEEDFEIRKNPDVYTLVHKYHYCMDVRQNGLQMHHIKIEPAFLALMADLQLAMSKKVAAMGLLIETLPSINLLISPIDRYDQHPLLRFAPLPASREKGYLQHTSLNTDNPGVSRVSLENEYTLLYRALQKQIDPATGQRMHSDAELQSWLQNLIQQGYQQSKNFG